MADNADPVKAAEQILKDAYPEARAEECPQGKECPIHFRVDEEYFDKSQRYARLITYLGDYVVVTGDNPKLESPLFLIQLVLGAVKKKDLPPRWVTDVIYVGEGAIADAFDKPAEEIRTTLRYSTEHNEWQYIKSVHDSTAGALKSGLIDVSQPWKES